MSDLHGPPESRLPDGAACSDCVHLARCTEVLGCTWYSRRECDFAPSRFRPREDASLHRLTDAAANRRGT